MTPHPATAPREHNLRGAARASQAWHPLVVRAAISLLTLSLLGCDPSATSDAKAPSKPSDDAATPEAATPEAAPEPAEAEPEPAPAEPEDAREQLSVDASRSQVRFLVSRAPIGHIGHFERFEATLGLRAGQVEDLQIEVFTESVVADRLGLTEHLKSDDFFDVAKYPRASFQTKTLTPIPPGEGDGDPGDGAELDNVSVVGVMRLHGVEAELTFPARFEVDAEGVSAHATLEISAKAFGIDYAGMEDELAEDAVGLEVALSFPRAAR